MMKIKPLSLINILIVAAVLALFWHVRDSPDPRHITPVQVLMKEEQNV